MQGTSCYKNDDVYNVTARHSGLKNILRCPNLFASVFVRNHKPCYKPSIYLFKNSRSLLCTFFAHAPGTVLQYYVNS